MQVTVDVKGDAVTEVEAPADATYADLLAAVDLSPQEVTVLVDGRPVPEDQPVSVDHGQAPVPQALLHDRVKQLSGGVGGGVAGR